MSKFFVTNIRYSTNEIDGVPDPQPTDVPTDMEIMIEDYESMNDGEIGEFIMDYISNEVDHIVLSFNSISEELLNSYSTSGEDF